MEEQVALWGDCTDDLLGALNKAAASEWPAM